MQTRIVYTQYFLNTLNEMQIIFYNKQKKKKSVPMSYFFLDIQKYTIYFNQIYY